jgi:hypothetical protein
MSLLDTALWILVAIVFVFCAALVIVAPTSTRESFAPLGSIAGVSLEQVTARALDAAPTTSEVKDFYKTLLVFADADIRRQGTDGLRILGDLRDRLFDRADFRDNLTYDDFLADWPTWLPPLDPTQQEPVPAVEEAVTAESRILAFLQRNYPIVTSGMADDQTNDVVLALVRDFGFRFVFKQGEEEVQLKPDFLRKPLLNNWVNPARS